MSSSRAGGLLVSLGRLLLAATAGLDEAEQCRGYFGAAYQKYMHETKMFVPYVF